MDNWDSFKTAFEDCQCKAGKYWIKDIEGNNCRLRHRIRRAFRKSCNFSKKMKNHVIAFETAFFISTLGLYKSIVLLKHYQSGKHTEGAGYFWSGCVGASKYGLEIAGFASIGMESRTALHAKRTVGQRAFGSLLDYYASLVET